MWCLCSQNLDNNIAFKDLKTKQLNFLSQILFWAKSRLPILGFSKWWIVVVCHPTRINPLHTYLRLRHYKQHIKAMFSREKKNKNMTSGLNQIWFCNFFQIKKLWEALGYGHGLCIGWVSPNANHFFFLIIFKARIRVENGGSFSWRETQNSN